MLVTILLRSNPNAKFESKSKTRRQYSRCRRQQASTTAGKQRSSQAGKHAGRHAAKHARRQAGKQANAKSKFEFESESGSKFGSDAEAYADAHFRIRISVQQPSPRPSPRPSWKGNCQPHALNPNARPSSNGKCQPDALNPNAHLKTGIQLRIGCLVKILLRIPIRFLSRDPSTSNAIELPQKQAYPQAGKARQLASREACSAS